MRPAKFWLRRNADGSPHITEDPDTAQFWQKTGVNVTELQPAKPDEEQRLREENEQLKEAIRRLADQDATLSVQSGNVIVEMDGTLTAEEREAVVRAISTLGGWQKTGGYHSAIDDDAATLRGLLERLGGKP